jgi:hypothetical protein
MRKVAIYGLGSLLALTALTGLAHTRTGLRAIAWVTGSEGCPFGEGEALTAAAAEQLRLDALAKLDRSKSPAPARPALGFRLDLDRRQDVTRWAEAHGVQCKADRSGAGLRCLDVAFADLPRAAQLEPSDAAISEAHGVVSFGFQPDGHLVSVQLQSATGTARPVLQRLAGTAMDAIEQLQPGSATVSGDALDSTSFVRRKAQVAFADYYAEVTATSLGKRWTVVETYQSPGSNGALAAR